MLALQEKLHQACEAGDSDAVRQTLMCNDVKGNNDATKKILLYRNTNGQSGLHLVCTNSQLAIKNVIKVIDVIFECVECHELLYELLCMKDDANRTILHLVCENERNAMILKVLLIRIQETTRMLNNWTDLVLLTDSDKNTVLHLACKQHSSDALGHIFRHVNGDAALIKKVMTVQNNDGMTILHVACNNTNPDITDVILDHVTDYTLMREILMKTYKNTSVLHNICYNDNVSMLKVILKHVRDDILLEDMLMNIDELGHTALHSACMQGHNEVMQCLEITFQRMKHTCMPNIVKIKDEQGRTPLHIACQEGFTDIIQILFKYIHRDKIKDYILALDYLKKTPFYLACAYGHHSAVEALIRLIKDETILITLVKMRNEEGMTPIDAMARYRHFHCLPALLGGPYELTKTIVSSDNIGSILRGACQHGDKGAVESITRAACEVQRREKHSMLQSFKDTDSEGKGILHIACSRGDVEILSCILSRLRKMDVRHATATNGITRHLSDDSDDDYSHIQCEKDNKGRTAFHKCCQLGEYRLVQMMCDAIPKHDHDFMALLLCNQNNEKISPLSEAVENCHHKTVKVIMYMAAKCKCLRKLLLECTYSNDQTLLHRACHYKYEHVRCLEVVLKKAHEYTDDDINDDHNLIKDLCFRKDIYGNTFVSYLSQTTEAVLPLLIKQGIEAYNFDGRRSNLVPTLLEAFDDGHHRIVKHIMDEAVNSKCIKKLLACTHPETLLHRACYNKHGHTSCMEAVLNAAHSYTDDPEVFRELFLSPDEYGRTFLFYLSDASEDVIRLLLTWAIEWDKEHSATDQQQYICYQLLHRIAEKRPKVVNSDVTALQYVQQKQDPTLTTKISTLAAIFDHYHDNLDSDDKRQPSDFVLFQTEDEEDTGLLHSMCDANCLDLIQHRYTKEYLHACWVAYGRYFFFTNIVLYAMVLLMLTTFVVSHQFDMNGTSNTDLVFTKASWIHPVVIVLIFFSLLTLVYEILQIITKRYRYFYEIHNYVDLIVCLTSLFLPISSLHIDYNMWHHRIGAIVMCLAWVNATWMITRVPSRYDTRFGQFLGKIILTFNMLFYVMRRGCFVIPVFAMLTMAFALCFHTVFQMQEPFSTIGNSLLRTIGMTIGELDMVSTFFLDSESESLSFKAISCVLFTIFLYMMTISAMNLLVGMAVGDINELSDKGEVVAFETLVELILESRSILSMLKLYYMVLARCVYGF